MDLLRSAALLGLGFWLGMAWTDPRRGLDAAARAGRLLVRAGETLIGMVADRADAEVGPRRFASRYRSS